MSTSTAISPQGGDANGLRGNKPKPLELGSSSKSSSSINSSFSLNQPAEPMKTGELMDLMNEIQGAVKSGTFNSHLATQIFKLYQQLKLQGHALEHSHKNELSRVFVSLRQACCRDSGQLGTPCRLKIMELVELRAMGWRPNLAHSQYYLNRPNNNSNGSNNNNNNENALPTPLSAKPFTPSGGSMTMEGARGAQPFVPSSQQQNTHPPPDYNDPNPLNLHTGGGGPISAPPFGSVPINPFAFAAPPPMQQHHHPGAGLAHPSIHPPTMGDLTGGGGGMMVASGTGAPGGPSHYYIVPGPAFMGVMPPPPQQPNPFSPLGHAPPPPPPHLQQAHQQSHHNAPSPPNPQQQRLSLDLSRLLYGGSPGRDSGLSSSTASSPGDALWPKGAVIKPSSKFTAPQKVPGKNQFRDEIVIRNADSGKIMGVKGRRVAVVEALSKTIISFQKVATGAKERTLTLTGNSEEEISYAKQLIEETIRRNVSPNRGDDGEEIPEMADATGSIEDFNSNKFTSLIEGGVLKLQCDDPEMLEAAREALKDYFNRSAPLRRSQGALSSKSPSERELKRERRKSMPSFSPDTSGIPGGFKRGGVGGGVVLPGQKADADLDWRGGSMIAGLPTSPTGPAAAAAALVGAVAGSVGGDSSERATTESPKANGVGSDPNKKAAASLIKKSSTTKSTPDLSGGDIGVSRLGMRVVYTKDYLLKCAASPLATCSPGTLSWIAKESPEILRPNPGKFNLEEYKKKSAEAKAVLNPNV